MATQRPEVKKLSKSVLEMKFMKKSKEKVTKERDEEEARAMFASEVTEAMRIGGNRLVIEPSFVPCEELIIGRLSYHGMNKEIERLLELEKGAKVEEKDEQNDMEISDAEMARRYTTLIGSISNKFKTKKEKSVVDVEPPMKKRKKFMKPQDD